MFNRSGMLCVLKKSNTLSRVWLAAMVSKKMFHDSVSDKILVSIDIGSTCEQIIKVAFFNGSQRYSLYLNAQLMCGVIKMFSYQVELFEKTLCKILQELKALNIVSDKKRRSKSRPAIELENFELSVLPPVDDQTLLADTRSKTDKNLLPEAEDNTILEDLRRMQPDLLTFGIITDNELRFFEDLLAHPQQDCDSIRHIPSDLEERTASLSRLINPPDVPENFQPPAINEDLSSIVEAPAQTAKTPQKRGSTLTVNAETPTKRRRRNLRSSFEEVAAEQTEFPQPINSVLDETANDPVQAPEHHQEETNKQTTTENNDLLMGNLIPVPSRIRSSKKRHERFIVDETTGLPDRTKQMNNVRIYTRPGPLSLLRGSSLKFHTSAEQLLKTPSVRSVNWARALKNQYKANTIGPFIDDTYEQGRGTFRNADSRIEAPLAEISSGIEKGRDTTTSRSKTIDDIMEHVDVAPIENRSTAIPDQSTEENRGQPLDMDIPIFENIQNMDTADIGQQTEPINQIEAHNPAPETARRNSNDSNDSFLPPNPPVANISNVPDSPSSFSSEDSDRRRQRMSDLMDLLETYWTSDEEVTFRKLAPPETCIDLEAGNLFLRVIDLSWKGKIALTQEVQGGEIKITRA